MNWKKGRGKLGIFAPLLGEWQAEAETETEMGSVKCIRKFKKILGGKYVQLIAKWEFTDRNYEELALIGVNEEKEICFWSFTSDGKQSHGQLADATDIHSNAICFEGQMPAGTARLVYWPDDKEGFHWVVESKTKKGWNRFVKHHYRN